MEPDGVIHPGILLTVPGDTAPGTAVTIITHGHIVRGYTIPGIMIPGILRLIIVDTDTPISGILLIIQVIITTVEAMKTGIPALTIAGYPGVPTITS